MNRWIINSSAILLCLFTSLILIAAETPADEIKFKEFQSASEKFEHYTIEAEKSVNEQEWQNILDNGRGEMLADWEISSDSEMARYIRQGEKENEVRISLEESRARWEKDYEAAESRAKGAWYLRRENLEFTEVDFSILKQSVINAGRDAANVTNIEEWDTYVSSSLSYINRAWDINFAVPLNDLKDRGDLLTGNIKAGFNAELAAFETSLKNKFEVERDNILYSGRNGFISEIYVDTDSLRYQSDRESAVTATDNIIKEVQGELKSEEDKILNKDYGGINEGVIDFSGMGDNWQDEIKFLVKSGMEKWNSALDRLYMQMASWRRGAEDAYISAESMWRMAAEKLENAKSEWENKLSEEIYAGLDNWSNEENELAANIDLSRNDFTDYIHNLFRQWDDHSSGLVSMAINGSMVYAEAVDNISWFEGKCRESEVLNTGVYGITGVEDNKCLNYMSTNGLRDNEFLSMLSQRDRDKITAIIGEPRVLTNFFNFDLGGFYTAEFIGAEFTENQDGSMVINEKYTIRAYTKGNGFLWEYYKSQEQPVTFEITNRITENSLKKSSYYYYRTELARWTAIKNSFEGIASDAEIYMHEKNMLGENGTDGEVNPGYLTNDAGQYIPNGETASGDPYLMTDAEFFLKTAERDWEFWKRRLDTAQGVLQYAESVNRDSAEKTTTDKEEAFILKERAKEIYENKLGEVESIITGLKNIQGTRPSFAYDPSAAEWINYNSSLEYLTAEYNRANALLGRADEDYQLKKMIVIWMENKKDNVDNIVNLTEEIADIEENIRLAEEKLYDNRVELYTNEKIKEYTAITSVYAVNYGEAFKNLEIVKSELTELSAEDDNEETRKIYFYLQQRVDYYTSLVEKLNDINFNPEEFLKSSYTEDHQAYAKYGDYSVNALTKLKTVIGETQNYQVIENTLNEMLSEKKFIYGQENKEFIEQYTAIKYFQSRFNEINSDQWSAGLAVIDSDIKSSRQAAEMHRSASVLSKDDLLLAETEKMIRASGGDIDAVSWLKEYYRNGSSIIGLKYIEEYNQTAKIKKLSFMELQDYADKNYKYFTKDQQQLSTIDYLQGLLGFISISSPIQNSGYDGYSIDSLNNLSREQLSDAAGAAGKYIDSLELKGEPVPEFLISAVASLIKIKESLDAEIFIDRYISGDRSEDMNGSIDDIMAGKVFESEIQNRVLDFIDKCGNSALPVERDDYVSMKSIITAYEGLTEPERKYIRTNENEKIKGLKSFIQNIYSFNDSLAIKEKAAEYADLPESSAITPGEYLAAINLNDNQKSELAVMIEQVYQKRIILNNINTGGITDINNYINDLPDIEVAVKEELLSYALISEYKIKISAGDFTDIDPAFSAYAATGEFTDLPFQVKSYAASEIFYKEIILNNRRDVADIKAFLETYFGEGSIDEDTLDVVTEYSERLDSVALYFGQDIESYITPMNEQSAEYFLMYYINGNDEAILPGFEYGIYGDSNLINGSITTELRKLSAELDSFGTGFRELCIAQDDAVETAETGVRNARALDKYISGPSGNIDNSEMNKMLSVFGSLAEAAGAENVQYTGIGIADFINEVNGIDHADADVNEKLAGIVTKYKSAADIASVKVLGLKEISGELEYSIRSANSTLASKRKSLDMFGGGSTTEQAFAALEESAKLHETAEKALKAAKKNLSDRQQIYTDRNAAYINLMSSINTLYDNYKILEFNYEKAYAVWEYANTPYLKESRTDAGEISTGSVPSGGIADYSAIPVPDAKENYDRINAIYLEKESDYNKKLTAVNNQIRLDTLNTDSDYSSLKADFTRKSEEYIRLAQVSYELEEEMSKYDQQCAVSKENYENAKDSITFYSDKEDADESSRIARDRILNNIFKSATMEEGDTLIADYVEAISWYGCQVKYDKQATMESYQTLYGNIAGTFRPSYQQYFNSLSYLLKFNSFSEEIKNDVKDIYSCFEIPGKSLENIAVNFSQRMYNLNQYNYAVSKLNSLHKWEVLDKKRWKKIRNDRWNDYQRFDAEYQCNINPIRDTLTKAFEAKIKYASDKTASENISSVKNISDIKLYLQDQKYGLTDADLKYLSDSIVTGSGQYNEIINLDRMRSDNEKLMVDINGDPLSWEKINDTIIIKNMCGKTVETFNAGDPGIRLGDTADIVYDRKYSIPEVLRTVKLRAANIRLEYFSKLKQYGEEKFDYTVVLRDLENTYHQLQEKSLLFNAVNEKRQRSFEGYSTITSEFANNGEGTSVQGSIIKRLIDQNRLFQEQLWAQQKEKLNLQKNRWNETVGYIFNRGEKEWRENSSRFYSRWRKWRFDTLKEIEAGENWWINKNSETQSKMNTWANETAAASSKASAEKIYSELEQRITSSEKNIKDRMPQSMSFDINTDSIISEAMKNMPVDSIGILSKSMYSADTTSGFAGILNLGLNGSLARYNEEKMTDYTQAVSIMQNLKVIDILNSIIDGFNSQLAMANKNVYTNVDKSIAKSNDLVIAPFRRKESENRWDIKICTASNLTGDKYKIRSFEDYSNEINSTVFLQPIKGIGTVIDFTDSSTYVNIDGEELGIYVDLESAWLNQSIEEVFREGGTFSGHAEDEYSRLGNEFGTYFSEWMAGEALKSTGFYAKPMFPNGPNMLQTSALIAGVAGGPWAAFAVSILTTGIQVSDGTMSWRQGALNIGMSAATACIGAGASQLGGLAGESFGKLAGAAVKSTVTVAGSTLVSSVKLDGKGLTVDTKSLTSRDTWTSAGVNIATSIVSSQYAGNNLSAAIVNGMGTGISSGLTTGDWKNSMADSMRNSMAGYLAAKAGGVFGNLTGLNGNSINGLVQSGLNDILGSNEKFSWDAAADKNAVGNIIGNYLNDALVSDQQRAVRYLEDEAASERQKKDMETLDFMDKIELGVSGIFTSLRDDISGTIKDSLNAIDDIGTGLSYVGNAVFNFAESVSNKVVYGEFGMDSNTLVENAKLNYQFESQGLSDQNIEMNYQPGAVIESDDGQIFQINLDEHGNRILFDTGVNKNDPYIQLAGLDSVDKPMDRIYNEAKDINSRYQAIHNYDNGETVINGIKIKFNNNSNNIKDNVVKVSGHLWNNLTDAADDPGVNVTGIQVSAVDYGSSDPHVAGVGIDITGLYVNGSTHMVDYRRDYKDGEFSPTTPDSVITNFENAFLSKDGSTHVWGPWQMKDNANNWDFKNMVGDYPGVAETGKPGPKASEDLKEFAKSNKVDSTKLFRSYQHTNHGHYQVDYKYSTKDKNKIYRII